MANQTKSDFFQRRLHILEAPSSRKRWGINLFSKLTADAFKMSACSAVSGSVPLSQKKPTKDPTEKSKFFFWGVGC